MFKKDALTQAATAEQLRLFSEVEGKDPDSKEAADMIERIVKIETVKTKRTVLSKDAVLGAAVTAFGFIYVINAEHTGAVTSKMFSWIRKAF